MEANIFHTVNSGLYVLCGDTGVLIDGIHKGYRVGFSDCPEEIINQCLNRRGLFEKLKGLLFTHCHPDHYDESYVKQIIACSSVPVYTPEKLILGGNTASEAGTEVLKIGSLQFYLIRTQHDGEQFKNVPHVSILVHSDGVYYFIAGDADLNESCAAVVKSICGGGIKLSFVNPYQLLSESGRCFLRSLNPERILLYHDSFKDDDLFEAKRIKNYALAHYPEDMTAVEAIAHMSWILN